MGFNLPKMGSNQAIEFGVIIILYIYIVYIQQKSVSHGDCHHWHDQILICCSHPILGCKNLADLAFRWWCPSNYLHVSNFAVGLVGWSPHSCWINWVSKSLLSTYCMYIYLVRTEWSTVINHHHDPRPIMSHPQALSCAKRSGSHKDGGQRWQRWPQGSATTNMSMG